MVIKKKIADELTKAQECVRRKDKRGALKARPTQLAPWTNTPSLASPAPTVTSA